MTAHTAIVDPETAYGLRMMVLAKIEDERARARNGVSAATGARTGVAPFNEARDAIRERNRAKVAEAMALGLTQAEIAERIGLSRPAVCTHWNAIKAGAVPGGRQKPKTKDRILEALTGIGGLAYDEIAAATGLTEKTVRKTMPDLMREGSVMRSIRVAGFKRLAEWRLPGVERRATAATPRDAVLQALRDRPGQWMSYSDIEAASGCNRDTVVNAMRWLHPSGLVAHSWGKRTGKHGTPPAMWMATGDGA